MELNWSINDQFWNTNFQCSEDAQLNILGLPNDETYLECATWTILSWSALIGSYNLRYGSLDNAHILYLASWLFKHADCIESSWLNYAVALSLSQAYHDSRTPFDHQFLRQRGFDLLKRLFKDQTVGDYAFLSYVGLLVELDMMPQEEVDAIVQKLEFLATKASTQKEAQLLKARFEALLSD